MGELRKGEYIQYIDGVATVRAEEEVPGSLKDWRGFFFLLAAMTITLLLAGGSLLAIGTLGWQGSGSWIALLVGLVPVFVLQVLAFLNYEDARVQMRKAYLAKSATR